MPSSVDMTQPNLKIHGMTKSCYKVLISSSIKYEDALD